MSKQNPKNLDYLVFNNKDELIDVASKQDKELFDPRIYKLIPTSEFPENLELDIDYFTFPSDESDF